MRTRKIYPFRHLPSLIAMGAESRQSPPVHDIGKGKHDKRGTLYNPGTFRYPPLPKQSCKGDIDQFASCGITALIGG